MQIVLDKTCLAGNQTNQTKFSFVFCNTAAPAVDFTNALDYLKVGLICHKFWVN